MAFVLLFIRGLTGTRGHAAPTISMPQLLGAEARGHGAMRPCPFVGVQDKLIRGQGRARRRGRPAFPAHSRAGAEHPPSTHAHTQPDANTTAKHDVGRRSPLGR